MERGLFKKHKRVKVAFDTNPSPGDMVWVDQTTGISYSYDNTRSKWLSTSKDRFEFARKGAANGMYIPLLGDLDDQEDVYMTGYDATIISVFCRSKDGNEDKTFEIRKNGTDIFHFHYDSSLSYIDNNLNIDIAPLDEINLYVSGSGKKVRDTVCRIEIARRHDI